MSISNYKVFNSEQVGDETYKIGLTLKNVHHSMANAIRRVLLAEIPIAAFDDTYGDDDESKSIRITKNISGIHNEFISHRLSLIPLCMYRNESLKIEVQYDQKECKYIYNFANPEAVPTFSINVTNNIEAKEKYKLNSDNSLNITSDMVIIPNEEEYNPVSEFIIADYITGDYCLLHRLKQTIHAIDTESAETLQVTMNPTIGTGQTHARYNPTGTVSYEFVKDSEENLKTNFKNYMDNLQQKRKEDGLEPFNEDDIRIFKDTFDVMGSERVYKKNSEGEPEKILMSVEGIGNLPPQQLFFDALNIIQMRTYSILNSFSWNDNEKRYEYNENKISLTKNIEGDYYQMTIFNEDHTIGNMLGSYLKRLFTQNTKFGNLLTFASYKLPHPLEKKIVVSMKINEAYDPTMLFVKSGLKTTSNPENIVIQLLMIAASVYLKDLEKLIREFSQISGVNQTSYINEDEFLTKSYFDRSSQLGIFLN